MEHTPNLNVLGRHDANVLVICDAVGDTVFAEGRVMPPMAMNVFAQHAQLNGFTVDDFLFVSACPPIPESESTSERKITAFLSQYRDELWNEVLHRSTAKVVVYLGSLPGKQLFGRPVLITRTAGQLVTMEGIGVPIIGMISPANVLKRPEVVETFASNFQSLARLRDANYNADIVAQNSISANYEWKTDISDLLLRPPVSLAIDTETIGYEWFRGAELLTVQMTYQEGHSLVLPVHVPFYESNIGKFGNMEPLTPQKRLVLLGQIRELLANPRVHVSGHNLKYDVHALRMVDILIANWYADTMQLAFCIDENMKEKSLDECTRRWVGQLSGYADSFNKTTDKSRMDLVPADKLLPYAGGDTDAAFRLTRILMRELRKDGRQLKTFTNIQMPSLRAFVRMEQLGVGIDQPTLTALGTTLEALESRTYGALIENTPSTVRRIHMDAGLKFSRASFTADTLFSPQGFGLRPLVFTKGTANTAERVPSVSSKTHLPFFMGFRTGTWATTTGFDAFIAEEQTKRADENKPLLSPAEVEAQRVAGFPYVSKLIDYLKLQKIRSTYVGHPGGLQIIGGRERLVETSGFWQYIAPDGRIHPSFFLHDTVTGRCVTGDARVVTNQGAKTMLEVREHLSNTGDRLLALTHNNRFRRILHFFDNGMKPVFEVRLLSGKSIKATANHPLHTSQGWRTVDSLAVGDTVYAYDFNYINEVEEWRGVDGFPCYSVSNLGRVRYCSKRTNNVPRLVRPTSKGDWGHLKIKFHRSTDTTVHKLIATAFHGACPEGMECLHLNGIPGDNRATNLKWGTSKENGESMIEQGRSRRGERSSQCKLSDADVAEIRRRRTEEGSFYTDMAVEYGVTHALIRGICLGTHRKPYVSPFNEETVVSITFVGDEATYDIEVEEDHSFVAENLVVHNSNSRNPNAQNLPKRGSIAKAFRKIFRPTPGYVLVEADLSQAELRIAAWMANELTMLDIYQRDGDIHTATAAAVMGISIEAFMQLPPEQIKLLRFYAKAVNFGFLYGMGWRKFKDYAKTEYGVDFTDIQAQELRSKFFQTYPRLENWHASMREFVRRHGYVRSLHGAMRHLPSVFSTDEKVKGEAERQAINCLSDDTEMMTADGWKLVDALRIGEPVFAVNPENGLLELQPLEHINVGRVNQTMLHYTGSVDAIATPNHRWLVDSYSQATGSKWQTISSFKTSQELSDYGDHKIWLAGKTSAVQHGAAWTDDEVELMGWVLTDGHYKKQRSKAGKVWGVGRVGVTQSKPNFMSDIQSLMARMGCKSHYVSKVGQHCWHLSCSAGKRMWAEMPDKTLTPAVVMSLTDSQRRLLYATMLKGDGCWDEQAGRFRKFVAGSKKRSDAFLMLCALIGQPANAVERDFTHYEAKQYDSMGNIPKAGKCWLVELKQRNRAQSGYGKTWKQWSGRVWCPTVRHGAWVAKRNGKVFITGNSPVQRFASDLGLMAMARLSRDTNWELVRPLMFIHDALVCEVRSDIAVEGAAWVKHYMESNPLMAWFGLTAPLPILSDVSIGDNLGEMIERKDILAVRAPFLQMHLDA